MVNVLIAEDDFRVAQIHEQYLQRVEDMNVVGKTGTAKDTLCYLQKYSVDLLLLDIYMPDLLGTELIKQIRRNSMNVDIILVTAAKEKNVLETALMYGIRHWLLKPVSLKEFTYILEEYKRQRKVREQLREIDQDSLNRIFGFNQKDKIREFPSGIDALTYEKVIEVLCVEPEGMTADMAAEKMGVSRTTTRRYLEYLTGIGKAKVEHVYGIVGRPERRYFLKRQG